MAVPFYRPAITDEEISEVVDTLKSGWLTTGPKTKLFETRLAETVGARHAVALNSCTAALHLALEAIGTRRGDLVVVPVMTFAATAEVVRYFDAVPVFVDCEAETTCISVPALNATLDALAAGAPVAGLKPPYGPVRAIIPMHYGGQMVDVDGVTAAARRVGVPVIEDAAHTLPAFYRSNADAPWRQAGTTADITCFSFYANKCITTGEGGMVVTDNAAWADRMRLMSLHGMSRDAWKRFTSEGSWYYEIAAPGFKYNLTDMASAVGLVQLKRADALWAERRRLAERYHALLGALDAYQLPRELPNRKHSWHLFSTRLAPGRWSIDRNRFIELLRGKGITPSVHYMPLHLHPYYRETYGYGPGLFPCAEDLWPRSVTLPLFPGMTEAEQDEVVAALRGLAAEYAR